jgi:hypothetical protein
MASKKSLEDKIRAVIKSHERQDNVEITFINVSKKKEIGFNKEEEIIVNYYTK